MGSDTIYLCVQLAINHVEYFFYLQVFEIRMETFFQDSFATCKAEHEEALRPVQRRFQDHFRKSTGKVSVDHQGLHLS